MVLSLGGKRRKQLNYTWLSWGQVYPRQEGRGDGRPPVASIESTHVGVVERRARVQRGAPGVAERLVDSHLPPESTARPRKNRKRRTRTRRARASERKRRRERESEVTSEVKVCQRRAQHNKHAQHAETNAAARRPQCIYVCWRGRLTRDKACRVQHYTGQEA